MNETELVGCHTCKGKKVLVGLGSFPMDCETCKGIGWIEKPTESAEDNFLASAKVGDKILLADLKEVHVVDEIITELSVKKKAGRPKQIKMEA